MRLISVLLLFSSALLAQGAAAQTRIFCCDDANGRKVCGDFLPPACQGRAYEERDNRGFVSKKVEAPLTAEQQARRARREAQLQKQKQLAQQLEMHVAYANQALALLKLRPLRAEEALEASENALNIQPEYVKALLRAGQSFQEVGR